MRKSTMCVSIVAMVLLVSGILWAETHTFKIQSQGAKANGSELQAGTYRIEFDGQSADEAVIYREVMHATSNPRRLEVVTRLPISVRALDSKRESKGTVLLKADREIQEIRLEKQVVVFIR